MFTLLIFFTFTECYRKEILYVLYLLLSSPERAQIMPLLNDPHSAVLTIREFLDQKPGACRRLIESFLVFNCGYPPNAVTAALRNLTEEDDDLIRTEFANPYGGRACHFYSLGDPDQNSL